MKTKYKLAIFVAFQPFLMMFDRFLYTFLYVNGFDFIQIAMLEILYSALAVVVLFVIGNYPDIRGRKRLVPLLMGYYSMFPLLYIRFRAFLSTVVIRFSEGLKHSYFPLYHSVTQDLSPKKGAGKYFGFVMAIMGSMGAVMLLFAGVIIEIFGFEALAIITSIIIITFCIFFMKGFPETMSKASGEHRRISLKVVKNRFIIAYCIYQFLVAYIFITNWIYLPIKSFDVTSSFVGVGLILFAGKVMFTLGQVPLGMLADKLGTFKIYGIGILLSSIASFLLGFVNQGMLMVVVNLFAGLAMSLTRPAELALVSENIAKTRRVEFNSIIHIIQELGVIFGVSLATVMVVFFNIDYVFYLQSAIFLIAPIAFFVTYKLAS